MNRLNRLLAVLFLILILVSATLVLVAPELATQATEALIQAIGNIHVLVRLAVVLVVDAVALILLYYQLRRVPTNKAIIRVRGTEAEISCESIEAQLHKSVSDLDNLLDVNIEVRPAARGRVRIQLDVLAAPEVLVADKVKEINKVVRDVAKGNLGLKIAGAPVIHVELASPAAVAHSEEVLGGPADLKLPPEEAAEPDIPAVFEPAAEEEVIEAIEEAEETPAPWPAPEPEPEPEMASEPPPADTPDTQIESPEVLEAGEETEADTEEEAPADDGAVFAPAEQMTEEGPPDPAPTEDEDTVDTDPLDAEDGEAQEDESKRKWWSR